MAVEIRTIEQEEMPNFLHAVMRGFHVNHMPEVLVPLRAAAHAPGRYWVAIDRGEIVATLRTAPFDTTLPGGATMATAGVTAVTVAATHRRQGLMSSLMRAELAAARDRGEPLASLVAAEWPIYGRFGFGPVSEHADYVLDAHCEFTRPGSGTIEFVDPATLIANAPAVYERHRRATTGEITRIDGWWQTITHVVAAEPWKGLQVLCRDDAGEVSGYVIYTVEEKWEHRRPAATVKLDELIAVDHEAEARLWRFLTEIDFVTRIDAEERRGHEPLRHWLADGRALAVVDRNDLIWARPLDTGVVFSARRYGAPGSIVVQVDDPLGFAGGRFRIESDGEDGASCRTTDAAPDLTLPMHAFGALTYGGTSLALLAAGGLVDEHTAGAVRRGDAMFRWHEAPWTATWF